MRRRPRLAAAGIATLALTGLAGCTSPTVDEASADYCERLETLQDELMTMRDVVTSDGTVDDLAAQRDVVREAYQATQEAADELAGTVASSADEAAATFEDAIDAIPGDASLSEAAGAYSAATEAYIEDLAGIASDADCS